MWVISVGRGQKGKNVVLVYVGSIGGTRSELKAERDRQMIGFQRPVRAERSAVSGSVG